MSQQKTKVKSGSDKFGQIRRRKKRRTEEGNELDGFAFGQGTHESQIKNVQRLARPQQQTALRNIGKIQGNRRATRVASQLQRHPGHGALSGDQEEMVGSMAANVQRTPALMRAELEQEHTQQATVNPAAAPLTIWDSFSLFANSLGTLPAGANVRILESAFVFMSRIHVERGPLAGTIGYVSSASLTPAAGATSLRTPIGAPAEDAYAQLVAELAKPAPSKSEVFTIIEMRMTADQQQRLLQAGNAEYLAMKAGKFLKADEFLHILDILGTPFHRKLTDYLDKKGKTIASLRLAFATANDDERLQVAQDDALVDRVRKILSSVHPEVIFGPTVLMNLYPGDGSVKTLATTNPNLARWLKPYIGKENLITEAQERAVGLQGALIALNTEPAAKAKKAVMAAVEAAPRGSALPGPERTALDSIEEQAYNATNYTSNDLGKMFLTRWGRPMEKAASHPKTFLHRLWLALKSLPDDNVLLNNVLTRFSLNTNPNAAGSFTDWLGDANFGTIRSNRPLAAEPVHADGAQNSRTIKIKEPHMDLFQKNDTIDVTETDGSVTATSVRSINTSKRTITLANKVNVDDNATLAPSGYQTWVSGDALRITGAAAFFADNAGTPNTAVNQGTLQPGVMVSKLGEQVVGPTTYFQVRPLKGAFQGQTGWIDSATVTGMGMSAGAANFEWTLRHEMGHALDLQVNGFSQFSAPSEAQWRKYTGAADWVTDLVNTAGIANSATNVVHNGVNSNFQQAARIYSEAVQARNTGSANALLCQQWLQGWVAAGGSQAVYDTVTQFNATRQYYNQNNLGLPPLSGRIFGAHYSEWFSAADAARTQSLAAGVSPYAYTCTYEFFADHYASYTGPGTGGETYVRAVPDWAKNYFDRLVGRAGAGPRQGMQRRRMGP
ncbi:MAG: hypothetical protein KJ063_03700 [Anaerolineae bacterium]|nr:hypothetical protein [Anaerolineae bacterium]